MFQREALEAGELARREASLARGMVAEAAAAADGVAEREVAGVRVSVEPGAELSGVVWEVAGDFANGVFDGAERG